jgi:hypothetical protein
MQALRHARFLARLVLAWFALSLGVAIASPLVNPQSMELVCASGGAMKLIVKNADGGDGQRGHTFDCPLCASLGAPPVALAVTATLAPDLAHVLRTRVVAPTVGRAAAALPARGPPSRS